MSRNAEKVDVWSCEVWVTAVVAADEVILVVDEVLGEV